VALDYPNSICLVFEQIERIVRPDLKKYHHHHHHRMKPGPKRETPTVNRERLDIMADG